MCGTGKRTLYAINMQLEKVCGAGDAGIVVADRLLALLQELLLGQVDGTGGVVPEIVFNGFLVLRGGRHNLCTQDTPFIIDLETVIQGTTRRFGTGITGRSTWMQFNGWLFRYLVLLDDAQRLVKCIKHLYTAYDNTFE